MTSKENRALYLDLVQSLRLARVLAGMNRNQLAKGCGVAWGTARNWETGRAKGAPSVLSLLRWAKAVGIEL